MVPRDAAPPLWRGRIARSTDSSSRGPCVFSKNKGQFGAGLYVGAYEASTTPLHRLLFTKNKALREPSVPAAVDLHQLADTAPALARLVAAANAPDRDFRGAGPRVAW